VSFTTGKRSTGHHIRRLKDGSFVIAWAIETAHSQTGERRDRAMAKCTNEVGARKFAQKHGCAFPE
jgi:hypothetical protein